MSIPHIDWQTIQTTLPGLPDNAIYARYEYTSGLVAERYNEYMQAIAAVYNKITDPTANPPASITQDDANAVRDAMNGLYNLALGNTLALVPPLEFPDGKKWFLNTEMVSNLELLAKTFQSVGFGWDYSPGAGNAAEALRAWKDMTALSSVVTGILQKGLDAHITNRSLQALVEMEYVKNGNDLIESKMSILEDQLALTSDTLDVLAALQDMHNKVSTEDRGEIGFNYLQDWGSPDDYLNQYLSTASLYFGTQLKAILGFTLGYVQTEFVNSVWYMLGFYDTRRKDGRVQVKNFDGDDWHDYVLPEGYIFGKPDDVPGAEKGIWGHDAAYDKIVGVALGYTANLYVNQLISLRNSLILQIQRYDATLTATQKSGAGNIYSALQATLDDLNQYLVDDDGNPITVATSDLEKAFALQKWMLDKYDTGKTETDQGAIQANITKAITSAQSLNETQKQDVKSFLFVFEEYYKSASGILQKITQLLERMAQGIRN